MEPVVVTSPDELLSALPHVLGFHPEESVVTVPFRAGMLTARVDIPRTAEERRQAIGAVSNAYAHHARPGEMVAVICVTEDKQAAQRSSMAMATALERVGVLVPLRVWATEKRWVELNSGQAGTRTRAAATRIAAEVAFAGHTAPAANRQELADSLVGDRAPVAGLLAGARAASTISGTEAERTWAVERLEQFGHDGLRLSDPDAARMLLSLEHKPTRDALWTDMSRANATTHVALWTDLTRRAPDEVRTPTATMLAFSSWLSGQGAKAWCALDQIPPGSPPYAMATIIATALHNATPPSAWEEARITSEGTEAFIPKPGRNPSRDLPPSPAPPDRRPPTP